MYVYPPECMSVEHYKAVVNELTSNYIALSQEKYSVFNFRLWEHLFEIFEFEFLIKRIYLIGKCTDIS